MTRQRIKQRVTHFLLTMAALTLSAIIYCNIRVGLMAGPLTFDNVQDVPHMHAALLLGTPPKTRNGNTNQYFTYRIDACAELFKAGKVDCIIVSGDNSSKSYNEPEAMRLALLKKGVPDSVMFMDYAGFRTLDSVVRASEIFSQDSFIVVSQRFHNERAIFLAHKMGLNAIGYNAKDINIRRGIKVRVREVMARCKVCLDLLVGKQPRFLGEHIEIG